MEMIIDFPGGARVDAHFNEFTVPTDQPPKAVETVLHQLRLPPFWLLQEHVPVFMFQDSANNVEYLLKEFKLYNACTQIQSLA